jgi:hypothetical protein
MGAGCSCKAATDIETNAHLREFADQPTHETENSEVTELQAIVFYR